MVGCTRSPAGGATLKETPQAPGGITWRDPPGDHARGDRPGNSPVCEDQCTPSEHNPFHQGVSPVDPPGALGRPPGPRADKEGSTGVSPRNPPGNPPGDPPRMDPRGDPPGPGAPQGVPRADHGIPRGIPQESPGELSWGSPRGWNPGGIPGRPSGESPLGWISRWRPQESQGLITRRGAIRSTGNQPGDPPGDPLGNRGGSPRGSPGVSPEGWGIPRGSTWSNGTC